MTGAMGGAAVPVKYVAPGLTGSRLGGRWGEAADRRESVRMNRVAVVHGDPGTRGRVLCCVAGRRRGRGVGRRRGQRVGRIGKTRSGRQVLMRRSCFE